MVTKTYIAENLRQIERLYNSTASVQKSLYYSKLAIIELGGWVEMSMDDIVLRLSSQRLKNADHRKYIAKEIVGRTSAFDYDRNFLRMIEAVIGRHGIEQMNAKVDNSLIQPLIGALSALKTARNIMAHQYIKGTTLAIDAPSITSSRFPVILAGLKNIEAVLLKK